MLKEDRNRKMFLLIAILINICIFVIEWVGWYIIILGGFDYTYFRILGVEYQVWLDCAEKMKWLHAFVCLVYVCSECRFLLKRCFSIKNFLMYVSHFFYVQVIVAYTVIIIFDSKAITGGLKHLSTIPFRYGMILAVIISALVRKMFDNRIEKKGL